MILLKRILPVIVLAVTAIACSHSHDPAEGASFIDVAQAAARKTDRVSVEQLAGWLIEDRRDFLLIDVRAADDFVKGRIGDARNIPIAELMTAETLDSLPRDQQIVLYSNGAENSAKAGVMLRLSGFDAHVLAGGYNAWHTRILNPDIPAEELDGESLQVSEQRAYACYFVGERSGAAARRPDQDTKPFVPPVFEAEDEIEPLPAMGEEGC